MARIIPLHTKLRAARELRGWSILDASKRIGFASHNSLRTLEGLNPDRDPNGGNCSLTTVLEIIRVYWPDVTLEDFTKTTLLFKIVPKNMKDFRKLKGHLAATG